MRDREIRPDDKGRGPGRIIHFDPLLLVILIAGWSLIFASASLAVRRTSEQWLPVEFVARMQRTLTPKKRRLVGGQIHDLVITPLGEYSSSTGL